MAAIVLEFLPGKIEKLEIHLHELQERMAKPDFFRGDQKTVRTTSERASDIPKEIEQAYARWAELDERV